jgi:O-antigen/teichoic acid export membrane protein
MGILRRLAGQTAIYGISSIVGRFLNYLLVPLFTYYFTPAEYGVVSEFYAYAGFFAVLLIFGFETGYFRFRVDAGTAQEVVYSTALRFLVVANLAFFAVVFAIQQPLSDALQHSAHPEYVGWIALILALDSVGAIAFARLRAEERAWRFAAIKIAEIGVNVGLCLFFIVYARGVHETAPDSAIGALWDPAIGVGYIFLANIAATAAKFLMLTPQLRGITRGFDRALFGRMLRYSLPMVVIGFAGIVNEMLDRALMKYLLPGDAESNLAQLGIYSACYKLSILMSLFIQAYRYAAEPFFFAQSRDKAAPQTYANVLTYFVIFCGFIFLFVTLYLDIFKYFIGEPYRVGLHMVPVLLVANILLGIYVNLSIWYKLTDRTLMGAWVSLAGAGVTILFLLLLVPRVGYTGAAWAHLASYSVMVAASYLLGRKYYPVPYNVMKVAGYIGFAIALFGANRALIAATGLHAFVVGTLLLATYLGIVVFLNRTALRRA